MGRWAITTGATAWFATVLGRRCTVTSGGVCTTCGDWDEAVVAAENMTAQTRIRELNIVLPLGVFARPAEKQPG